MKIAKIEYLYNRQDKNYTAKGRDLKIAKNKDAAEFIKEQILKLRSPAEVAKDIKSSNTS